MIQIMSSNGEISYGVNDYVIDTDNELNEIPNNAAAGSTAYSIESGTTFIKDNMNEWSILNTSNGSGGGTVDLPDNLLYSYDMGYNEFWENKNNETLEDGLYKVTLNDTVTPIVQTSMVELPYEWALEGTYNDNLCWILDYAYANLLQINEFGEIEAISNIADMIEYQPFSFDSPDAVRRQLLSLDGQGYMYISGQGQNVIGINTNNISDMSNWKFNQGSLNIDESIFWTFQSIIKPTEQSSFSKNIILDKEKILNFNVKDGGCFAVKGYGNVWEQQGELTPDVAYFKNGELKFIENQRNNSILFDHTLATVDYDLNKLYFIGAEINSDPWLSKLKLCTINTDGVQEEFDLCSYVIDDWKNLKENLRSSQLFVKNDILYFQFFSNNDSSFYYFLFDTVTNKIIGQEIITYNNCNYVNLWSPKNDIYHTENYSIIPFKLDGDQYFYDEETGNGWNEEFHEQKLIKIYHTNDIAYVQPEDVWYNLININKCFIDHCCEDKFFYIESWGAYLSVYNFLKGYSQGVTDLKNTSRYELKMNFPEYSEIFVSYVNNYADKSECIKINFETGNVEKALLDTNEQCMESSVEEYFKDEGIAFINNCVIDANDLKVKYIINYGTDLNSKLCYPLVELNGRKVYYSSYDLGYVGTNGALNTSQLVHDNNILLSKNL